MSKKSRRRCERQFRKHFEKLLHELNIAITIRKRNEFIKVKKLNIAMILIMRHEFENEKKSDVECNRTITFRIKCKTHS